MLNFPIGVDFILEILQKGFFGYPEHQEIGTNRLG